MAGMSKRVNDMLRSGANNRWPGSGDHLVNIHEFMRQGGRERSLSSAVNINFFLTMGGDRGDNLTKMKAEIDGRKPTRDGQRMSLYKAAIIAVDALVVLHGMAPPAPAAHPPADGHEEPRRT
jgi:hypothetical protein